MDPPVNITKKELVLKDRFTSYYHYHFLTSSTHKEQIWETVIREIPKEPKGAKIIAISKSAKLNGSHVILILSYRIPVESWVLEFPAGINDSGDIAECAVRELKEETGYVGKARPGSEKAIETCTDPWKSNDDTALVVVDVDLDDKANADPKQELGTDENIKVLMLPLKNLKKEIEKVRVEKKVKVETSLWAFAEGLELSQNLG